MRFFILNAIIVDLNNRKYQRCERKRACPMGTSQSEGRDVALKPAGSASRRHTSSKASAELELLASGRAALRFIWEHDGSR